jgi:hypothetical protein
MTKYFQQFNPTISGDEKYNSFQTRLATLASTYPAAANSYLNNTLCTRYSRSDALNNKGILTFCGCHLPISQYDILENTGVSTFVCDSLCSNTIAIPTVQTGSLTPNICNQPVCVINDVAITLINSTTGPISINQVCNGCSGAQGSSCNCAIVNVDLQANSSQLNRIDFSQNCGNPTCYKNDSTGVLQVVDCGLSPSEQQDQANQEGQTKRQERIQQSTNRTVKIILIVLIASIVLLLLIAIIIFVLSKKKDEM